MPGPIQPGTRVSQIVGTRTVPQESARSDTAMQAAAQKSVLNMHARVAPGHSDTASAPERSDDMKESMMQEHVCLPCSSAPAVEPHIPVSCIQACESLSIDNRSDNPSACDGKSTTSVPTDFQGCNPQRMTRTDGVRSKMYARFFNHESFTIPMRPVTASDNRVQPCM